MKFHTIISTIAVTLCAMVATAQAELKVASVNVTELYTMFYKRFDTEVRLKDEEAKIKAAITAITVKILFLFSSMYCSVCPNHDSTISSWSCCSLFSVLAIFLFCLLTIMLSLNKSKYKIFNSLLVFASYLFYICFYLKTINIYKTEIARLLSPFLSNSTKKFLYIKLFD